jgi:serine protease Do
MSVTEFPNECSGQQSLEALSEQLRSSSVLINSDEALGSGIIIASSPDRTVILTNRHVVESEQHGDGGRILVAPGMEVLNDGRRAAVLEVRIAPHDMDLAVVIVQGNLGPPVRTYMGSLSRGNSLLVVGSPLGYEDSFSRGILSNFSMRETGSGYRFRAIQTDAAINPGNSGGGVFLSGTGELVGITSFKMMVNPLVTAEGMGFAIPIHYIYDFPYSIWREIRPGQAGNGGSPG